jgi:hypothetical protein
MYLDLLFLDNLNLCSSFSYFVDIGEVLCEMVTSEFKDRN